MRLVRMSGAKSKVTISALMYATWRRMGILQELHLGIVLEDVAFHVLEQLVQLLAVGSRGLNDDRVRHMLDYELRSKKTGIEVDPEGSRYKDQRKTSSCTGV